MGPDATYRALVVVFQDGPVVAGVRPYDADEDPSISAIEGLGMTYDGRSRNGPDGRGWGHWTSLSPKVLRIGAPSESSEVCAATGANAVPNHGATNGKAITALSAKSTGSYELVRLFQDESITDTLNGDTFVPGWRVQGDAVSFANETDVAAFSAAAHSRPRPDGTDDPTAETVGDESVTLTHEFTLSDGRVNSGTAIGFRVGADVGVLAVGVAFTSKIPVDARSARWAAVWAKCLDRGDGTRPAKTPAGLTPRR